MSDYPPPPPPPSSPPPPPPGQGYGGYGPPPSQPFSVGAAFGFGWRAFWRNAGPFVLVALLMWVVNAVLQGIGTSLSGGGVSTSTVNGSTFSAGASGISFLFSILASVANVFFNAAMVRGALDVADGRPVSVGSMFERWNKGTVLVAALIVAVLTIVGLVLCLLPGVVFAFLAWFTTFFIVDRGMPAWDGVKASVSFSSANVGPLLLCALLGFLVLVAGLLVCIVGLLAASPIVTLATAYAYRSLQGQPVTSTV
ncbi:MAG TPA: hypothetical protein VI452_08130 [Marmoricola sp.]